VRRTSVELPCQASDPELFYDLTDHSREAAKAICRTCPVIVECLALVMRLEGSVQTKSRHGVWAATSPAERYAMSRRLRGLT
jgi:hypothetical protein